jgi:GNAT superfamily N-acetyltransferase
MHMKYSISSDKSKLDIDAIHDYLCNKSYWAKGRSFENVKRSIDNSMSFGLYDDSDKMIGFSRVVTDYVAFAYLMDVFIFDEHQGDGLGKMLVKHIIEHPELQVKFWLLGTINAHRLYKKLGFSELKDPERFMVLRDDNSC